MRELLAIVIAFVAAVAAAAVVWRWWRSPVPTFLIFTPILHGILLGVALHYLGAMLKVNRWSGWTYVAAIAGYLSAVALLYGQYVSDAYAYRDAARRAAVLVVAAPGSPRSPEPMGVLDSYDWNVVHPRTGKTGMRGYAALRNVRDERPAWVWFGEGTIVVVLAAFLASPRRDRGAADQPPPQ